VREPDIEAPLELLRSCCLVSVGSNDCERSQCPEVKPQPFKISRVK
jgi:hypothetical protein